MLAQDGCIGNDSSCPCHDGLLCHYVDDPDTRTKGWPITLLTQEELTVLSLLTEAHNHYMKLPEHHPMGIDEWVAKMHDLQTHVMARAAVRCHPDVFIPFKEMPGPIYRPEYIVNKPSV